MDREMGGIEKRRKGQRNYSAFARLLQQAVTAEM